MTRTAKLATGATIRTILDFLELLPLVSPPGIPVLELDRGVGEAGLLGGDCGPSVGGLFSGEGGGSDKLEFSKGFPFRTSFTELLNFG